MKFIKSKKALVLLASLAVIAISAVGAFAYFTNGGSGTGSATVGSSSNITLAGTVTGAMTPDGVTGAVSVLVTNPGSGSQFVNKVHLVSIQIDHTSATYTGATSTQQATWDACDVTVGPHAALSDPAFSMADITVGQTLTKSGTAGDHTTVTGTLSMNDTGVAQDNCQGAPLQLSLSSN